MSEQELGLVKVYTKKRGVHPDLTDPICLRKGATIEVSNYYDIVAIPDAFYYLACMPWYSSFAGGEIQVCARLVSN